MDVSGSHRVEVFSGSLASASTVGAPQKLRLAPPPRVRDKAS